MEDLISVDWASTKPSGTSTQQSRAPTGNYYSSLRPTPPLSGRATPLISSTSTTAQKTFSNVPTGSKSSTQANDSFANLVKFNAAQSSKNLSLQERQRTLQEQKAQQEAQRRAQFDSHFGSQAPAASSGGNLGHGRSTPNRITSPPTYTATDKYGGQRLSKVINKPFAGIPKASAGSEAEALANDEDDLLAAFNASAPVDTSSHMPSLTQANSFDGTYGRDRVTTSRIPQGTKTINEFQEDAEDDPFGLGTVKSNHPAGVVDKVPAAEDDDVLGLLGRPVSEFPKPQPIEASSSEPLTPKELDPQGRAIADLVDMGFSFDKAESALESTESGADVQAAVGWLLNQAHEDSRKKSQPQRNAGTNHMAERHPSKRAPGRRKSSGTRTARPAWMNEQGRPGTSNGRQDSRSPAKGEKDQGQHASDLGKNLFSTAGKLWKTGTERLNQAVSEFNSDSDSNQPKWMREAHNEAPNRKPRQQQREHDVNDHDRMGERRHAPPRPSALDTSVTDEALMLESGDASRPGPKKTSARPQPGPDRERDSSADRPRRPVTRPREEVLPQPRFMLQAQAQPRDPRSKLSRQAVEEEAAQAYISPARRKKSTPRPPPPDPEAEPDLLSESSRPAPKPTPSASMPNPATQPHSSTNVSLPTRSTPPKRSIPSISPSALKSSISSRQAGTAAFKRGDYAETTIHYTTALSSLPQQHTLTIPVLTNRALSHSKNGDPKASMADAEAALTLIGPSRGTGESIDLGGNEGVISMDTYWGKAMTRKAEALEHLERWTEAATAWRTCVEGGVGGATGIAGRNRCEKAARPEPKPAKKPPARPPPRSSALYDFAAPGSTAGQSAEAVSRLRAANAAADRVDDEKFALADRVDARVTLWRKGKEGNLRALLSSLETVLGGGSGWKKVGMGDVLMPGKVKVVYMRGIGKVHPDKLPTTATTEQRMISAAVFATLNEAWERFKGENGL